MAVEEDDEKKPEGEGAAPEGAENAEDEAKKKKAKKKKKLIIIGAATFIVLAAGGGGAFFMLHKSAADADKQAQNGEAGGAPGAEAGKPVFFPLGDLLVNLSGEGKHPNFLKVKISLELAEEKDVPLMDSIKPRIIDNFQVYLRELRIEDLRGSAGMYRLREELLMRVTEAAAPVRVRDVLFQEMLVQ